MKEPTGVLDITFRCKASGETYLAEQYFKLPLQVMSPHYQDEDGTAFLYLLNPSGGILQHDRLLTKIRVEENAKALVTTPSSTKFYGMDEGYAVIKNEITVEAGGVLEYLPEHNVPFAASRSYQENNFYLDREATLIAADLATAGRKTKGEVFQYDFYSSQTKIYVDGKLVAYDKASIEPAKMKLDAFGMLEGYTSYGTIYIYKENLGEGLARKITAIENRWTETQFAASAVNDSLTLIRLLGHSIGELQQAVQPMWDVIRKNIFGKPAVRIRKY